MAEQQQVSTAAGSSKAPTMCANGCGFFGGAATKNFCSKCYNDLKPVAELKKATTIQEPGSSSSSKAAPALPLPVTAAPVEEEKAPAAPIQCAAGCGFFGSAATGNMCSRCYIDSIKTVDAAPELLEKIKAGKAALVAAEKQPVLETAAPAVEEAAPAKAAPNRCQACRKKVGLLGFSCNCGGLFCSLHRYAEKHACDFDFKAAGREKIAKNNPLVAASKINKI